jgi:prolyl-tRNA editing enzyme YbaK/EbsC (Cys-tRNA(Pro) deacylase)
MIGRGRVKGRTGPCEAAVIIRRGMRQKMTVESVREYLAAFGMADRVMEFETSSATVELAAQALGVPPGRIAKTLSFRYNGGCLLVLAAGDAKIDNAKYKAAFGVKARMLDSDEILSMVGYAAGGVCPFAIPEEIAVFLDASLRRFETVFPACGSANSAVEMTCDELYRCARARQWVDVCKGWEE